MSNIPFPTRSLVLATAASLIALAHTGCGGDPALDPEAAIMASLTADQSYLVSFAGGGIPADADAVVTAAGGTIGARYTRVGAVLARSSNASFAAALRASSRVEGVGAVAAVSSRITPLKVAGPGRPTRPPHAAGGDPLSFRQWDMDQIHAPQARAITRGRPSVLVGLFDSGIDVNHPDLVGQVNAAASATCVGGIADPTPSTWQNDAIGHGTLVSGIIAGKQNGIGIVGIAPGVKLAVVRVTTDDGLVLPDAFLCAVDWALGHGYDIVNASLSLDPFTGPIDDIFCSDQPDRQAIVVMVRRALLAAAAQKVTVIAAAGNAFTDLAALQGTTPGSHCVGLPVQSPHVIGVSAIGFTRKLSWFSNYGRGAIDVTAPGGDNLVPDLAVGDGPATGQILTSADPNSFFYQQAADYGGQVVDCQGSTCATYAYVQGTSAATPHVVGVAALIESLRGRLAPDVLLAALHRSATPLPCPPSPYDPGATGQPATCSGPPRNTSFYGAGEVDALAALR